MPHFALALKIAALLLIKIFWIIFEYLSFSVLKKIRKEDLKDFCAAYFLNSVNIFLKIAIELYISAKVPRCCQRNSTLP